MLDRLKMLEENVADLERFKKENSIEKLKKSKYSGWALRYGFQESIQVVIDISCHLVSKYNMGNPDTYGECIELLRECNHIDIELEEKLLGMVGLRNLLIHEYSRIDIEKLYKYLEHLDDIRAFINQIKGLL